MTSTLVRDQASTCVQPRPEIRPGYTVRVHERITEGNKERVQIFEGLVIAVHKGMTDADSSFTVRRIASGVGVEKIFALHSPLIEKVEVKKVAKVRRSKLLFLRGRRGKAARLSERFTTADEFAVAAPVVEEPEVEEETTADTPESTPEKNDAPAEEVASSGEQPADDAAPEKTEEKKEEAPAEEAPVPEEKPAEDAGAAEEEDKAA